jgi:hypothetical protein
MAARRGWRRSAQTGAEQSLAEMDRVEARQQLESRQRGRDVDRVDRPGGEDAAVTALRLIAALSAGVALACAGLRSSPQQEPDWRLGACRWARRGGDHRGEKNPTDPLGLRDAFRDMLARAVHALRFGGHVFKLIWS